MHRSEQNPGGSGRLLTGLILLLALPPLLLFIITPMDVRDQTLLGVAGVLVMLVASRIWPDSRRVTLWLVLISIVVSTRYLYWRATHTLMFNSGLEYAMGIGLFVAELYAWLIMVLGYLQTLWPLERRIVPLPEDTSLWPSVDVYIPTYNEDLSVVADTVLAAQNLDYPKDKFQVYLLDDGSRPEFAAFASRAGVGYIARDDNRHAKAGNLNNAMKQTHGDLICVFDCDHIPTTVFLQATVGGFLTDPGLSLVQTPHYFYSPDPFERNLGVREDIPREGELFYGPVQKGNDFWNATFFCGSCAVIRRAALDEIDGFAVETVTEDAHTALRMQRRGWRTAFLGIPLAAGLATERLSLHIGQRARWARGMMQILRIDNPLLGRGLTLPQRLCYLNAAMHFLFPLPRVVFVTAPLAYLLMGQNIIASSAPMLFAYALPHLFHAIFTNSRANGRYRHTFWAEIYETVLAFQLVRPTLATLWSPRRGKFNVTEKGGLLEHGFFDAATVRPQIIVAFLLAAGLGWGLVRLIWHVYYDVQPDVMALNIFWAGFSYIIVLASIAVARERRQLRNTVRVPLELSATLYLENGHRVATLTRDISVSGVRLALPPKDTLSAPIEDVELDLDGFITVLPVEEVSRQGSDLRLCFKQMTLNQRRALVRIVMGRADAWLPDKPHENDRPLHSFRLVLRMAMSLFFWRWMTFDSRQRRENRQQRREFLGRYGVWVGIVLLLLGLLALGLRPAFADTGPQGVSSPAEPVSLTLKDLGAADGLRLRGDQAEAGFSLPLRDDEVVTRAAMTLNIKQSPALRPGARLIVEVNGETVQSLTLPSGDDKEHHYSFDLSPDYLVSHNRVTLILQAVADSGCPNALDRRIWAQVGADSHIDLVTHRLALSNDLSRLPVPFFNPASAAPARLNLVFPERPSEGEIRAAAITASWFGVQSEYRGTRFHVYRNQLPAAHALVFLSNGDTINGLTLAPVSRPTLREIANPDDPLYKLLVLQAPDEAGLITAARFLAHKGTGLDGPMAVAKPVAMPPRQNDDAPRWVSTAQPLHLGDLTRPSALRVTGIYPSVIHIDFRTAPDLFLWPGNTIALHLRYRFPEGTWLDESKSHLDVSINGHYLKSLPVNRHGVLERIWGLMGGDRRREEAVVRIPPSLIYGKNQLTLYFNLRYTIEKQCNPSLPTDVVSQVYPDSTLDLRRTRHLAALPNLSLFVAAGFPFSERADLSGSALVLPAQPDDNTLAAAMDLMARIGGATGYTADKVRVALGGGGLKRLSDRHLLVVAPVKAPVVERLLAPGPFSVIRGRLRAPSPDLRRRVRNLLYGHWLLQQREADRAMTSRDRLAALLGTRSPLNGDRQMVLATASDASMLPGLVQALDRGKVDARVGGDVTLIDSDNTVTAYRVAPATLEGRSPWVIRLLWRLGQRPFVMTLILIAVLAVVAAVIYPLLRRRAQRRMGK